ncbi:hypothetical protein os1_10740 [Comamonadaceae bacterium OS-1]|nr:hypothetical protein os1_10740 [Comamonadaceae bacterium OS-1]
MPIDRLLLFFIVLFFSTLSRSEVIDNPAFCTSATVCFFVAKNGSDDNSGSIDDPFFSLDRAQYFVRYSRSNSPSKEADIYVVVRAGIYEFDKPLYLTTPEDGGTVNGARTTYISFPGEKVIFSGGRRITSWSKEGLNYYSNSNYYFRQLYVDGRRAVRARWPNQGNYSKLKDWFGDKNIDPTSISKINRFITIDSENLLNLENWDGVELFLQREFGQEILRIERVEVAGEKKVFFKEPENSNAFDKKFPRKFSNQSFHLENSKYFIDSPYEWYLDPVGKILISGLGNFDPNMAVMTAPKLSSLIFISGDDGAPLHNLTISGFVFSYTGWIDPMNGFSPVQANIEKRVLVEKNYIPGAISASKVSGLKILDNYFNNLGGVGFSSGSGLKNSTIKCNIFEDISAGAIVLDGDLKANASVSDLTKYIDVSSNLVSRIGLDYYGAAAIFAGYVSNLTVDNNIISDAPYTGISVGWGWTEKQTQMQENNITGNSISNVMNVLSDGAPIYLLSSQPLSNIRYNVIDNVNLSNWATFRFMAGIYLDKGVSGVTVEDNNISSFNLAGEKRVVPYFDQYGNVGNSFNKESDFSPEYKKIIKDRFFNGCKNK